MHQVFEILRGAMSQLHHRCLDELVLGMLSPVRYITKTRFSEILPPSFTIYSSKPPCSVVQLELKGQQEHALEDIMH